jgi:hypothetical protein
LLAAAIDKTNRRIAEGWAAGHGLCPIQKHNFRRKTCSNFAILTYAKVNIDRRAPNVSIEKPQALQKVSYGQPVPVITCFRFRNYFNLRSLQFQAISDMEIK